MNGTDSNQRSLANEAQQIGPRLLVVNQRQRIVHIIDPCTFDILAKVATRGDRPHEAVVSADGRFAFLPIYGDGGVGTPGTDGRTVEVLDLAMNEIVDSIDLGRPARPHGIRLGPDALLYLTSEVACAVDILDPVTRKLIASIPTQQRESHMVVLTRDGSRAYTSNVCDGSISVLDLVRRKPVALIPVAPAIQRISISVDEKTLFTTDQSSPRLALVDIATKTVREWIALPSVGYATHPTADGKWLLVTLMEAGKILLIDLATKEIVKSMDVPAGPIAALFDPHRPFVYVTCFSGGKVAVVDWRGWKVEKLIDAGVSADGLAWVPGTTSR